MKFANFVKKRGKKDIIGMPKVLYTCRFLSPAVVTLLVIYNGAVLDGIVYS